MEIRLNCKGQTQKEREGKGEKQEREDKKDLQYQEQKENETNFLTYSTLSMKIPCETCSGMISPSYAHTFLVKCHKNTL